MRLKKGRRLINRAVVCQKLICTFVFLFVVLGALSASAVAHEVSRQTAVVDVVREVGPAVVNIRTEQIVQRGGTQMFGFGASLFEEFFRGFSTPRFYKTQSLGSGVIIDPRGYVLTNTHVVEQASKIYVALDGEQKEIEAKLVGVHERLDLAVVQIAGDPPFPYLEMGKSSDLLLGETVIAIGNPLGLGSSVTTGVVSSTHRRVPMPGGQVGHFIQTDALINPGNSGGPLLNTRGDLIGINTAIARQAQGIGFSIPIDMVARTASDLIQCGEVRKSYLGVMPGTVSQLLVRDRGVGGTLVTEVDSGSPAQKGGISVADVILSLDGMIIESPEEMMQLLDSYTPDDQIRFHLLRGNDEIDVYVDLAPFPEHYGLRYAAHLFGFEVRDSVHGVIVSQVHSNSAADAAGLNGGDRVAEVDGVRIKTVGDYEQVFLERIGLMPLQFLIVRGDRGYYLNLP
jgi:serine protease Do